MRILVLGGTGEAHEVAARLHDLGHQVTTSLAGRTRAPRLPPGEIRSGGFGGAAGLAEYLQQQAVDVLIDATHPYAEEISTNAAAAASSTGVRLIRCLRPAWSEAAGERWLHVPDIAAAAAALPVGAIALVTTGHTGLEHFAARTDCSIVARLIEPPAASFGEVTFQQDRPPYTLAAERALFARHGFTHLVSKNSGGEATRAKLDAARETGATIIMVARPPAPTGGIEVANVEEAVAAARR